MRFFGNLLGADASFPPAFLELVRERRTHLMQLPEEYDATLMRVLFSSRIARRSCKSSR